MKAKVHYVSRYDVPNRDGGGRISGIKVQYQNGGSVNDHTGRGEPVITVGGDEVLWSAFPQVPGLYDLILTTKPDAKGKAVMYLTEVKHLPQNQ